MTTLFAFGTAHEYGCTYERGEEVVGAEGVDDGCQLLLQEMRGTAREGLRWDDGEDGCEVVGRCGEQGGDWVGNVVVDGLCLRWECVWVGGGGGG